MGKSLIRAAAAALLLSVLSFAAQAAGLGRLTVLSSLGQPFRGEIDLVSVKKEELASLTARIASPDAFRQADLPFTAYVSNLKLAVEKRPNGDLYVKVSAAQPLNEPFIDFLVELAWTSGRLVRSYTALVDPPAVGDEKSDTAQAEPAAAAPAPAAEPASKAAEPATEVKASAPPAVEAAPLPAEPKSEPAPAPAEAAAPAPAPAKAAASEGISDYKVKRGDTLAKIARANRPADVSLEQMLVLLYRDNPDAFDGKNMNRLRAGRVLRLPDATEVGSVSADEARKEVKVQAANWNAYREKLAAAAPALEEAPSRASAGKVTTKVEEKAAPSLEPPKEVLKLSKGEPAKAGAAPAAKDGKASQDQVRALEEEVASKGKAVADANERIAQLEKQIKDMQALVEMKSKGMADLQKAAPAKPGAAPTAPEKPVTKLEPTTPTPMKAEPAPSGPKLDAKTGAPDLVPHKDKVVPAAEPATPPVTAEAPLPAPEPPKPPKKKVIPLPPPPPPPSLVDQILGEPLYLAGGGAVIALLGGLGYMSWKRRRGTGASKGETEDYGDGGVGAAAAAALSAGAAADDERQTADSGVESDPLAEAEVFLIYGRDGQAEERLKEAIAAAPTRYELHAKLLEIYAKRGDALAFEPVAKDLQMGTGGQGELWEKAVRLGYQLDPGNPRYLAGKPAEGDTERTFPGSEATVQMEAMGEEATRSDLDFNLGFDESPSNVSTDIDLGELGQQLEQASATKTDIDIGTLTGAASEFDDIVDPSKTIVTSADEIAPTVQMAAFDPTANLAAPDTGDLPTLPGIPPGAAAAAADDLGLDFDLGDATKDDADKPLDSGDDGLGGISFDLNTLKLDSPPLEQPGATTPSAPDLDLGGISLELDQPGTPPEAPAGKDEKWYDVQTKFDLAKAYQEMGDKEGAREILQEVIADGDGEQKAAAQSLLDSLG